MLNSIGNTSENKNPLKLWGFALFLALAGCHSAPTNVIQEGKFPTEEEVTKNNVKGLSKEEVIAKYGKPTFDENGTDGSTILDYIKPDHSPIVKTAQFHLYAGFQVILRDGKVTDLTITYENKHPSP